MPPKVTVFTPSNQPQWLDQCWDSLKAQTFGNFEWYVGLNGGATWDSWDGMAEAGRDGRVWANVIPDGGIGALKAEICKHASGEFLVELDHDDLLTTTALEEIVSAFTSNPEAGLVYSNAAQVNEDLSYNDERFADGHGWAWHDSEVQVDDWTGKVMVCEAKPPTPHNVSYIWYAPNHVRAFRRSVYESVGGYDASLSVCDDADLMCRMYQAAPFVHIDLCLYLQRLHSANTQRDAAKNALIQSETVRIYDDNVQRNALVWAGREGLACLDLGGAHACPEGYTPIDKVLSGYDIFHDLLQYDSESVGVIRAVDFLEHVADKVRLMNEMYRVLAPGGMLLSLTPSTDGRGAFCDPTHTSYWNELSFRYYTNPDFAKYVPEVTARFRESRLLSYFPSAWHHENHVPYVLFNGAKDE